MKTKEEILKKSMDLTKTFLEIAKQDLKAAKCLYDRELYPQATFYLQQSTEKAAKSFAIMIGTISEDEVKDIGHVSLKIHRKIINEEKKRTDKFEAVIKKIPELEEIKLIRNIDLDKYYEGLNESQQVIDYLLNEKESLVFLSEEEIMGFIEDIKKLESEHQKNLHSFSLTTEKFDELKENITELIDILNEYNPNEAEKAREDLDNLNSNQVNEMLEKLAPLLMDVFYVHISLFYLSRITFPHAIVARYPNDNLNPLEIYNGDLPLIKLFEECIRVLGKTLNKIEDIYTNLEEVKSEK